ncbi:DNA-directed RNA polymerase subunit L [Candidatus Woesearchaeota archaeon]|nr:MAG: DNA-directed RNA polymerase subunit L [Candidatus Woesearchaeota archaeon ex4484_78]RLE45766.1 MAG: DNA-directed RNA polymerase subunit L [Candidatus Woesearchaeota archaeon]
MEIKIIEEKKNKIIFEITGEGHTLANALRKELWEDNKVKVAAYNIDHPQVGEPRFILETTGEEPRKALTNAAKRLQKTMEKIKEEAKKLK